MEKKLTALWIYGIYALGVAANSSYHTGPQDYLSLDATHRHQTAFTLCYRLNWLHASSFSAGTLIVLDWLTD